MEKRVFQNPLIKDKITFLKTSKETNGEYTLVEVELAVGGGNNLHAHTTFDEEFIPVEGTLGIDLGKTPLRLTPGEKAIAPVGKWHRFYNPGTEPIRFHVKITPSNEGFENCLKIAYGLADDGKVNKSGVPTNFAHLSILLTMSDTRLPGIYSLIHPVMHWKAKQARKKGIEQQLVQQYC